MNEHRYILEPYHGTSSRHTCPKCGQREFTYFIDTTTGKPLSPKCGRCNRESSCGYIYTPRDLFADNPDERPEQTEWKEPIKIEPPRPQSFIPNSILTDIQPCRQRNGLYAWLCSVFDTKDVDEVFSKYHVGTSKHWRIGNYLATAFPQVNERGQICQLKTMMYNPDNGHRLHKEDSCLVWSDRLQSYIDASHVQDKLMFVGKKILNDNDAVLHQTFFGCHLIPQATTIGIVESEKSALICSILLPTFVWIATGGAQGCRFTEPKQAELLKGKKIVLFADQDKVELWDKKAEQLRAQGIDASCSHICEGKANHCDIADLIVENQLRIKKQKKAPDYKPVTIGELCRMMHDMNFPKNRVKINA